MIRLLLCGITKKMEITIKEKSAGPSMNIKKNNEVVMESGISVTPEAAKVEAPKEEEVKSVE